jgi:hypothetical protein
VIGLNVAVPKYVVALASRNDESIILREAGHNVAKLVIPLWQGPLRTVRHDTLERPLSQYSDDLIRGKARNITVETFLLISKRDVQQFLLIVFGRIFACRAHSLERSSFFFGGP